MYSPRQIPAALAALALIAVATPSPAAAPEPTVSEAAIVPLFPQKERDLKKGLPPGMTAVSFWAGRGVAKLTKLPDGKVLTEFDFEGLIPYGVYTLWNVLETDPFKDEPYTEFGAGKHTVVADGNGRAHKVVLRDSWPGKEFLLDYHADGKLSQPLASIPERCGASSRRRPSDDWSNVGRQRDRHRAGHLRAPRCRGNRRSPSQGPEL